MCVIPATLFLISYASPSRVFSVDSHHVRIEVDRTGISRVSELTKINFCDPLLFILRFFSSSGYNGSLVRHWDFSVKPDSFTQSSHSAGVGLYINKFSGDAGGPRSYKIRFRASAVVRSGVFAVQVVGFEWDLPLPNVSFSVNYPKSVQLNSLQLQLIYENSTVADAKCLFSISGHQVGGTCPYFPPHCGLFLLVPVSLFAFRPSFFQVVMLILSIWALCRGRRMFKEYVTCGYLNYLDLDVDLSPAEFSFLAGEDVSLFQTVLGLGSVGFVSVRRNCLVVHTDVDVHGSINKWVARWLARENDLISGHRFGWLIESNANSFRFFVESEIERKGLLKSGADMVEMIRWGPFVLSLLAAVVFPVGYCGFPHSLALSFIQLLWLFDFGSVELRYPRVVLISGVVLFGLIPRNLVINGTFWDTLCSLAMMVGGGLLFAMSRFARRWTLSGARLAQWVIAVEEQKRGSLTKPRIIPALHSWRLKFLRERHRHRYEEPIERSLFGPKEALDDEYESSSGAA
jgi:hypothetical protein